MYLFLALSCITKATLKRDDHENLERELKVIGNKTNSPLTVPAISNYTPTQQNLDDNITQKESYSDEDSEDDCVIIADFMSQLPNTSSHFNKDDIYSELSGNDTNSDENFIMDTNPTTCSNEVLTQSYEKFEMRKRDDMELTDFNDETEQNKREDSAYRVRYSFFCSI